MARKQQKEDLQEDQCDCIDLSDTALVDMPGLGSSEKAKVKPLSTNKNVILQ